MLTADDRFWIAERLLSRAREKTHDLARLARKEPTIGRGITADRAREEVAECMRLAGKLQAETAGRFSNLDTRGEFTDAQHVAVLDAERSIIFTAAPLDGGRLMPHYDAVGACRDLRLLGIDSWRLPSIEDLLSLVDRRLHGPAVPDHHFAGPYGWAWSDSAYLGEEGSLFWGAGTDCGSCGWGHVDTHEQVIAVCDARELWERDSER